MRAEPRKALAHLRSPRLMALGLAIFVTYAYFLGRPAWNQNSRFALTRALVEHQSPIIDEWHATTGDKSKREGHYYCDKAPGISLLATVPYAVFYAFRRARGASMPAVRVMPLDPVDLAAERAPPPEHMKAGDRLQYNRAWRIASYLCRIFSVALLSMLGVMGFFVLAYTLAREGGREDQGEESDEGPCEREALRLAIIATGVYALATPAFAYSLGLYGHQPVAALLICAAAQIYAYEAGESLRWGRLAVLASSMGLAVCCEYPAAVPVAILCLWAASRFGVLTLGRLALLGLPWIALLLGYHAWAFGHPFATGYDFVHLEEFAAGMRVRYDIGVPDPHALFELTFGSYRGLFSASPVLLLALWGWHRMRGPLAIVGGSIIVFYFALNSGYYMWDGGAAVGPRHCIPALPFLALGLLAALRALPRAVFALAMISGLQMLLVAYSGPEAPSWGHPIWGHAFTEFAHFKGATSSSATNLGRIAGLPGPLSLVPLALAWIAIVGFDAAITAPTVKRRDQEHVDPS